MFSKRFMTAGFVVAVGLSIVATYGVVVSADNAWGPYHWARTTNSFDLTVINSTTGDWHQHVKDAATEWSQASALNMIDVDGSTNRKVRRRCKAPDGQVLERVGTAATIEATIRSPCRTRRCA